MKASKVLIRGQVFDYAEKAPFVVSGMSVLGALEYDSEAEKVKCHECGEWFRSVSLHLSASAHPLTPREYRIRHGLRVKAHLASPGCHEMRAKANRLSPERLSELLVSAQMAKMAPRVGRQAPRQMNEQRNLDGRCKVQTLFRVQVLAAQLKRTPTSDELAQAGIYSYTLIKYFGGRMQALEKCELIMRNRGKRISNERASLPKGFPSEKQLKESRMPWPKEYFGVRLGPRSA